MWSGNAVGNRLKPAAPHQKFPFAPPPLLQPIQPMTKPALLPLTLALGLTAGNLHAQAPAALKTQKEKISYAVGMDVGENFKKGGLDLDPQVFTAAIRDALTGGALQLTEEQKNELVTAFKAEMRSKAVAGAAKAQEAAKAAAPENKKKGTDFLAANKGKPGVATLPDGLQYKVVKEGTGPTPTSSDRVSVNYTGTLIDGTEFDSSKGTPISFGVTEVIKGWTEALMLMKVGSKWQLFIPSDLAYGDTGTPNGGPIPPGATLVFDVELLGINK